ncbi:MAG: thermostable hemolysin [Mariprofundales bacterium]|nr:thermostable hemolysin [Mariprofundales bacterium]
MIDLIPCGHEDRHLVEAFIHQRFEGRYHANIKHFMPYLLQMRHDGSGDRFAVAGARPARDNNHLFIETYLDSPVEQVIGQQTGSTPMRCGIVEIGNLAEAENGGARHAVVALTGLLHGAGFTWVAFTAVRLLANTCQRVGLEPIILGNADPSLLDSAQQREWGSYYDNAPQVMCGRVDDAFNLLNSLEREIPSSKRTPLRIGYQIGRRLRSQQPEYSTT